MRREPGETLDQPAAVRGVANLLIFRSRGEVHDMVEELTNLCGIARSNGNADLANDEGTIGVAMAGQHSPEADNLPVEGCLIHATAFDDVCGSGKGVCRQT